MTSSNYRDVLWQHTMSDSQYWDDLIHWNPYWYLYWWIAKTSGLQKHSILLSSSIILMWYCVSTSCPVLSYVCHSCVSSSAGLSPIEELRMEVGLCVDKGCISVLFHLSTHFILCILSRCTATKKAENTLSFGCEAKDWERWFLIYSRNWLHLYLASFQPPRRVCFLHK